MRLLLVVLLALLAIVALILNIQDRSKDKAPETPAVWRGSAIDLENRFNQLQNDHQELLHEIRELRKALENRK